VIDVNIDLVGVIIDPPCDYWYQKRFFNLVSAETKGSTTYDSYVFLEVVKDALSNGTLGGSKAL